MLMEIVVMVVMLMKEVMVVEVMKTRESLVLVVFIQSVGELVLITTAGCGCDGSSGGIGNKRNRSS